MNNARVLPRQRKSTKERVQMCTLNNKETVEKWYLELVFKSFIKYSEQAVNNYIIASHTVM